MARERLLVIDDEPAITALIRRTAEPAGFQVVETSEPDAFKHQLEVLEPDVICLDLAMPRFDGIEILRFLARRRCRSQLLIISGFDPGMVQSALRLGEALGLNMAGTIAKPIDIARLRTLLGELTTK
jgi:CheY-like chemotaxis protein